MGLCVLGGRRDAMLDTVQSRVDNIVSTYPTLYSVAKIELGLHIYWYKLNRVKSGNCKIIRIIFI